jgi:hypothetical protein
LLLGGGCLRELLCPSYNVDQASNDWRKVAASNDSSLHRRLLDRDPLAPADLAREHLEPLVAWLRRRFPFTRVEDATLVTAAIDLLLNLAERPQQFDSDRGSLVGYLRMAAWRDVQNALTRSNRQSRRLVSIETVELGQDARNVQGVTNTASDPADVFMRNLPLLDSPVLETIQSSFDAIEWQVVELIVEGERHTAAYARVLDLTHLPALEQASTVKRVKDRLLKRLQRLAPRVPRDE